MLLTFTVLEGLPSLSRCLTTFFTMWRNLRSLATHRLHSIDFDQTGQMQRLVCLWWAPSQGDFVGFVTQWLNLYEPRCEKTGLRPGPSQTRLYNHIQKVEGLYYPYSENKGADQLRSYCAADLRLCFRICKKPVFS